VRFHLRTHRNAYTYCTRVRARERTFRSPRANIACIIQKPGDWLQPSRSRARERARLCISADEENRGVQRCAFPDLYSSITTARRCYNCLPALPSRFSRARCRHGILRRSFRGSRGCLRLCLWRIKRIRVFELAECQSEWTDHSRHLARSLVSRKVEVSALDAVAA